MTRLLRNFAFVAAAATALTSGLATAAAALPTKVTSYTTTDGVTYVKTAVLLGCCRNATFKAACPSGTHVLGGGFDSDATDNSVALLHEYPYDSGDKDLLVDDGWGVQVANQSSATFQFAVYAICSSYLPVYRVGSMTLASDASKSKTISCNPSTDMVTAGGTRADSGSREIGSLPNNGQFTATVFNRTASTPTISVFAICTNKDVASYTYQGPADPQARTVPTAPCPDIAPHAVGGGFGIFTTSPGEVTVGSSRPIAYDQPADGIWSVAFDAAFSDPSANAVSEVLCLASI